MLSFGIELSRAFWIAAARVAFASGSPPPSFAATMIARDSFDKSWPRFASAAPFFRLMVAHLLCPDTCTSDRRLVPLLPARPGPVDEPGVQPEVVGQLRVERRHHHVPVAGRHTVARMRREDLDAR